MPAISMIRQRLGDKTFTSYVPATDEKAKAFAEALMPGEYEVFSKVGDSGSDSVSDGYKTWLVMVKNEAGLKTYLSFATPLGKTSDDVINALVGKTFNSVKADRVIVINSRSVTFASSDSGSGGGSGG